MKRGPAPIDEERSSSSPSKFEDDLIIATKFANTEQIVDLVKNNKADVNATDCWGYTPLMIAASNVHKKQYQVTMTLLELGANPNSKNINGETAIMLARESNQVDAVQALTSYQSGHLGKLPEDLFKKILGFLPAYSFKGKNNLNQVSQLFNDVIGDRLKIKIDHIVDSCKNEEDALSILSDEALFKQLETEKLLQIISFVPDLAIRCINEVLPENNNNNLRDRYITILCSKHLKVAQEIIFNANLSGMLSENVILNLSIYHTSLVEDIMNSPVCIQKLEDSEDIDELVDKNVVMAKRLVNMPQFRKRFYDDRDIVLIARHHLEIAEELFSSDFINQLLGEDLAILGQLNEVIANRILDSQVLSEKLESEDLKILAHLQSVANRILETPNFIAKLSGNDLLSFAKHESIAEKILDTPSLLQKINPKMVHFLAVNERIAHKLLGIKNIRGCLNEVQLYHLAKNFDSIAIMLLDSNQLSEECIVMLICDSEQVCIRVLDTPELRSKFELGATLNLCRRNEAFALRLYDFIFSEERDQLLSISFPLIAKKVLENHTAFDFQATDLCRLGLTSYSNALRVVTEPSLYEKLDDKSLFELSGKYVAIAKLIYENTERTSIKNEIKPAVMIHDTVKAYIESKASMKRQLQPKLR